MLALCAFYINDLHATIYEYQLATIEYVNGRRVSARGEPISSYEVDDGRDDVFRLEVTTHVFKREFVENGEVKTCVIFYMHVYEYYENDKHYRTEFYPGQGDCD
ncbi:MAG: hypothetical protein OXI43_06415 [Candidatus Poribacteria bacterium]|nr:hypothetical protein [Candidatus Poribacteria bacterium]